MNAPDTNKTAVAPLIEALDALRDRASFHMPGHKGREAFTQLAAHMDATEIDMTDDLYRADGAIAKAQRMAAMSARAAHTIFLTNGSTCGVEAMLGYAAPPGSSVILPRASHMSAISALALYGIEPVWVDAWADEGGAPFTREQDVLEAIGAHPEARAVLLTRPDYYGRMLPMERIAERAHQAGMLVLVDEAHGAHLNWLDGRSGVWTPGGTMPEHVSALDCGADMCVQSAHKTLPALTSAAYLHMNSRVDADRLLGRVALTQTSSPSFLIMASLDGARAHMDAVGRRELDRLCGMCEDVYRHCEHLDIAPVREHFGMPCDRTRLALDLTGRGISGHDALAALEQMGMDAEMSDARRVVMICTVADAPDDFAQLKRALDQLPRGRGHCHAPSIARVPRGERVTGVRSAALGECERVPLSSAAGRVAARALGAYPPGVAECVPGEMISGDAVARLDMARRTGSELFGLEKGMCVVVK